MVFLRAISAVAVSALLVTSVANGQGDSADRYAFEETPVLSLAQADPQTATVEVETQVERHERPATVGMGASGTSGRRFVCAAPILRTRAQSSFCTR